jgi:hypothetical protein
MKSNNQQNDYAGLSRTLPQNGIGSALSSLGSFAQSGGSNKYKLIKKNFFLTK